MTKKAKDYRHDLVIQIKRELLNHHVTVVELAEEMKVVRTAIYKQYKTMNQAKYDAIIAAIKRISARKAGKH